MNTAVPSIGWSQFARDRHKKGMGHSYCEAPTEDVLHLVKINWQYRTPGHGETGLDRKVVVPIKDSMSGCLFFLPTVRLRMGLPVQADVVTRQEGEDPYIETYVDIADAKRLGIEPEVAETASIVCYSAEALLENGGTRTTEDEWEIVCVLASNDVDEPPMTPLTMARNFLEKTGGTKSVYTAEEFAKAIYYHATRRGVKLKAKPRKPIKEELVDLHILERIVRVRIGDLYEERARNCPHALRALTEEEIAQEDTSVAASCELCGLTVGSWRCRVSPDSVCHTKHDVVEGGQYLGVLQIDGSITYPLPPLDPESIDEETCVFCGLPDERK